ncbi:MAG TPA: rhodanese-like domain-containing protein [Polyangiaceae bacterium]|nr:rhodanese-like domain-containing protein [Polyangiaceae bacterium]
MRIAATMFFVSLLWLAREGTVAASPRDDVVVSVAWLAAHRDDANLVLLHVGEKDEYRAKHLPRARLVALSDISISSSAGKGLMLEMPPADDLRHRLEALGISERSRLIVYFGKGWASPATRVIFTLDYAGLGDRTALLDGGMDAWIRAGNAVTDEAPPARTGSLEPLKIRPLVVAADFVRTSLGKDGVAVVDGRASAFYDGIDIGGPKGFAHRAGHVAGARSVPFTAITDERSMLRSNEDLSALFSKAGVKNGDTVVGYCHIGQQATAMLFAARLLGHPVLLYDGSFEDWTQHKDFPVDNPARRGSK